MGVNFKNMVMLVAKHLGCGYASPSPKLPFETRARRICLQGIITDCYGEDIKHTLSLSESVT